MWKCTNYYGTNIFRHCFQCLVAKTRQDNFSVFLHENVVVSRSVMVSVLIYRIIVNKLGGQNIWPYVKLRKTYWKHINTMNYGFRKLFKFLNIWWHSWMLITAQFGNNRIKNYAELLRYGFQNVQILFWRLLKKIFWKYRKRTRRRKRR